MAYEETWNKIWCPKCKIPNWICDGDMSDLTDFNAEAVECFSCAHQWWRIDPTESCYYDPDDNEEKQKEKLDDNAEKGEEAPRGYRKE